MPQSPFGLYIHWPFCVSKCPYCDFNSYVSEKIDQDLWAKAYMSELKRAYLETQGRTVSSIFFGGGTPSLMNPKTAGKIIETADQLWGLDQNCEITLEANPSTVENQTFPDFKQAGINRLSIGIQSLRPEILKFLGRAHDELQARDALKKASETFDRFSFDLIYAYQDQTLIDWKEELNDALILAGGHLSVYQLTIEPGTDFHKNNVPAMDNDRASDFYDLTQEVLDKAGLAAYEISNHARPGQENRHNLIYWEGHDYLGLGPGAHSRLTHENSFFAIHQIYKPDLWLNAVFDKNSGEQKRKIINKSDRSFELLMMGLRINKGLSLNHFENVVGQSLYNFIDKTRINDLIEEGLLLDQNGYLKATDQGRKCLNAVLGHLV